jgi:enoyl-CoA hydratase/carnithine racemase
LSDFLQISRDGAVVTWTMNHPATRNALTGNTAIDEIVAAASAASTDPSVRAIILTGAGPVFSSGGNVKDMARFAQPGLDANIGTASSVSRKRCGHLMCPSSRL